MVRLFSLESFLKRLAAYLEQKDYMAEDRVRPERHYPLYWLAPAVDRGIVHVQLSSLLNGGFRRALDSKLYHYLKVPRALVLLLSILFIAAFKRLKGREPLVLLASIEGRYVVEKGHFVVRAAAFLNRGYLLARVMEYDYASLKKRMSIQLNVYGGIVGIAGEGEGTCSYYGVCPENAEVLIKRHNVPVEKPVTVIPFRPAAGIDRGAVGPRQGGGGALI